MSNDMLDSYRVYVTSQCSFWSPGHDDYLSGEILSQWHHRKSFLREMTGLQAEVSRIDGVISGLFFEQKQRLSRLGRNGGWSKWLKRHNIPRSTADRLVMEHVEFFGLQHELPKRERPEPLLGNITIAACRVSDKHEQMLKSTRSKIVFLSCLADRLGLEVDTDFNGSVRLSAPSPEKPEDIDYRVPNVIQIDNSGKLMPVNYELQEGNGDTQLSSLEISIPEGLHPTKQGPANPDTDEAGQ
jgi:hypothetical protein